MDRRSQAPYLRTPARPLGLTHPRVRAQRSRALSHFCCIDLPAPLEPKSAARITGGCDPLRNRRTEPLFSFFGVRNPHCVFANCVWGYNGGTSHLLPSPSPVRSAMRYPILPAGAFLAAFLVLIPACWLWRTRNVPTLSLIVWLFILNVVYGANSLVWSDNVRDKAPVWCDICECLVSRAMGLVSNTVRRCSRQTYHWSLDRVASVHVLYMQVPRHGWRQPDGWAGWWRPQENRHV